MGRQLQKKKNRSSNPKVSRHKNTRVHKIKSFGNDIVAKNWNKNETLSQNYARLGLTTKLNASTWCTPTSTRSIASSLAPRKTRLQPGEAKIIHDEEGNVIRVEHAPTAEEALDEEWTGLSDEEGDTGERKTSVVAQLEERARGEVKTVRTQSERERGWIEGLVVKYGRDYKKMARDRRLNPFQQTEGDIRRRIVKWEKMYEKKGAEAVEV